MNHIFGLLFLNGRWTINIGFYNDALLDVRPLTADQRETATPRILASFEPTFR